MNRDELIKEIAKLRHKNTKLQKKIKSFNQLTQDIALFQKLNRLGHWELDLTSGQVQWSDQVFRLFGFEPGTCIPDIHSIIGNNNNSQAEIERIIAKNIPYGFYENKILHPDGKTVILHSVFNVINKNKRPQCIVGTVQDVTKYKLIEAALRTSEAKLSNALKIARLGYWEYDVATNLFTFNDQFYSIFRTTADEVGGYTMTPEQYAGKFLHPDDMELVVKETNKALETDDPDYSRQLEHRIIYADGEVGHISVRFFITKDNKGRTIKTYGANQDITERKRAEATLQHSRKMDAIGQLAGGVAHDFNNMLGGIMGAAEILSCMLPKDDKLKRFVNVIMEAAGRAAELTQKLLAFSRKAPTIIKPFNIHLSIDSALSILERSIDKRIKIIKNYRAQESIVNGDMMQLQNAVLNLGVNARDAMPEGGHLTVETVNTVIESSQSRGDTLKINPGRYIKITVSDTGIGMDKKIIERIFEPFFTTKGIGKGTGLGLAAVYGTVQDHHGWIETTSIPGRGTTLTLMLPVVSDTVPAWEEPEEEIKTGQGCVLVVDDESVIRAMLEGMLKSLGYEVILAVDGIEAVEIYQEQKQKIDLVILDMIMPRRSGKDTFFNLKKLNPQLKVIISSGFSLDSNAREIMDNGANGFIQKPFRLHALSQKLYEVMQ